MTLGEPIVVRKTELQIMSCVRCGKVSEPSATWPAGWGCLYGTLAVCSLACAEAWLAAGNSRWPALRPGDLAITGEGGASYDPLGGEAA